jgi:hypothetical protein
LSAVPELQLRQIARWCDRRVPNQLRDQVRVEYRLRGRNITIVECRPPFMPELGPDWTETRVAQLRYTPPPPDGGEWTLHWSDSHNRWHPAPDVPAASGPGPLLATIESNPHGIFWS